MTNAQFRAVISVINMWGSLIAGLLLEGIWRDVLFAFFLLSILIAGVNFYVIARGGK